MQWKITNKMAAWIMVNVVLGITPYGSFFFGFFPCMTNVRIWLYRSSDSKKIKNSAVESMRFVVTLDVHINPGDIYNLSGKRSVSAWNGSGTALSSALKKGVPLFSNIRCTLNYKFHGLHRDFALNPVINLHHQNDLCFLYVM